jgi:hypothetical protein
MGLNTLELKNELSLESMPVSRKVKDNALSYVNQLVESDRVISAEDLPDMKAVLSRSDYKRLTDIYIQPRGKQVVSDDEIARALKYSLSLGFDPLLEPLQVVSIDFGGIGTYYILIGGHHRLYTIRQLISTNEWYVCESVPVTVITLNLVKNPNGYMAIACETDDTKRNMTKADLINAAIKVVSKGQVGANVRAITQYFNQIIPEKGNATRRKYTQEVLAGLDHSVLNNLTVYSVKTATEYLENVGIDHQYTKDRTYSGKPLIYCIDTPNDRLTLFKAIDDTLTANCRQIKDNKPLQTLSFITWVKDPLNNGGIRHQRKRMEKDFNEALSDYYEKQAVINILSSNPDIEWDQLCKKGEALTKKYKKNTPVRFKGFLPQEMYGDALPGIIVDANNRAVDIEDIHEVE